MTRLSYLMGAESISDQELAALDISIEKTTSEDHRCIKIPEQSLSIYLELLKEKMTPGFWNEVIGEHEIIFLFRLENGSIKQMTLSPETEREIDDLCAKLNNEEPDRTANVYKYIAENSFYSDFMHQHYSDLINRS